MVKVWDKILNPGHVFIIAEAGVNHNGDLALAKKLVDAAVAARVDAIKFQMFKAERLVSLEAPKADYQKRHAHAESHFEMLKRLELGEEEQSDLFHYCNGKGITFLSTPFDRESADFLDRLGMEIFKVPSGELTNHPLLEHIARKGKPMIISTGMSTVPDIEAAVSVVRRAGNEQFILLYCVSKYPAEFADIDLKVIETLRRKFGVPIGFSDHTGGIQAAVASVSKNVCVIEKHFTLDKNMRGPDHAFSLNAATELPELVACVRRAERETHSENKIFDRSGEKIISNDEKRIADVARKSLVAARDIRQGAVITVDMVEAKRPGTGLPPAFISTLIGKKAKKYIPQDTFITREMFE